MLDARLLAKALGILNMFGNKINPEKIKKKNTKLLKKLGINVVEHLPWVEVREHRSATEVAERCVILSALLQLRFGAPKDYIENYLKENDLIKGLSPEECKLLKIDYDDLEEQDHANLNWSIEAIWALAWIGKKHDSLSFNTGVEDTLAKMLPNFEQGERANAFVDSFNLRSEKEVFTELDKFYRAHWFARNNKLNGQSSPLVDLDIIMERRRALEWVSNNTESWDEISLDT